MDNPIKLSEKDRLFAEAILKRERGDFANAFDAFVMITSKFPDHAASWVELGDLLQYRFNDVSGAESCYQKAIAADGNFSAAYTSYADVLLARQRYAEANAMVNKALAIAGNGADRALYKSGLFRESQSRFDEAIDAYKKAILSTFSDEILAACEKGIQRCEVKKKYQ